MFASARENVTLSPDGRWFWNGSEWIPAPPTSNSNVNIQDSVISGDLSTNQNLVTEGTVNRNLDLNPDFQQNISISDSVVTGNISIQNNQVININIVSDLKELNLSGSIGSDHLSDEQKEAVRKIVSNSKQVEHSGAVLDAKTQLELAKACAEAFDNDTAVKYYTKAKQLFYQDGNNEGLWEVEFDVGRICKGLGQLEDAYELISTSLDLARQCYKTTSQRDWGAKLDKSLESKIELEVRLKANYVQAEIMMKERIKILNFFGQQHQLPGLYGDYSNILRKMNREKEALELLEEGLANVTQDNISHAILVYKIGSIKFDMELKNNDFGILTKDNWRPIYSPLRIIQAIRNFKRRTSLRNIQQEYLSSSLLAVEILLKVDEDRNQKKVLSGFYCNIGIIYLESNRYDQGRIYFHKSIEISNTLSEESHDATRSLAKLEAASGNIGTAKSLLNELIAETHALGNKVQTMEALLGLGHLYYSTNLYISENNWKEALEISVEIGHPREKEILRVLTACMEAQNNIGAAEFYYKRYLQFN